MTVIHNVITTGTCRMAKVQYESQKIPLFPLSTHNLPSAAAAGSDSRPGKTGLKSVATGHSTSFLKNRHAVLSPERPCKNIPFNAMPILLRKSRPICLAALLACLLLSPALSATSISEGLAAFDSRDYPTAYRALTSSEADRNPEAQTRLGLMYLNGLGVEKNAGKAILLFEKAARQGQAQARFELGKLILSGKGSEHDTAAGSGWLERAADAGYLPAINELGNWHEKANRRTDALHWYEKSAAKNDPEGEYRLARLLLSGEQPDAKTARKAFGLIHRAATQNHAEARFRLAEIYRYGDLAEPDADKALFWYRRSAAQHYLPALTELADIYENGLMDQPIDKTLAGQLRATIGKIAGTPTPGPEGKFADTVATVWDTVKPFTLLLLLFLFPILRARARYRKKQIESGMHLFENGQYELAAPFLLKPYIGKYPEAEALLGEMLALGLGVEKDIAKAMLHLTASSSENGRAAFLVGTLFENGDGVPQNDNEAFFWYERGAQQGDGDAMNRLGMLYAEGRGTGQDDEKAFEWLEKSAETGCPDAQASLATLCHLGRGTPKDEARAFELTAKGAGQNHPTALYNLAVSTRYGYGTPVNETKALALYRQGAVLKDRAAIRSLADMLEKGAAGQPPAPSEARFWQNRERQLPKEPPSRSCLRYPG